MVDSLASIGAEPRVLGFIILISRIVESHVARLVEVSRLKESASIDKTVLSHQLIDEINVGHGELVTWVGVGVAKTQRWMVGTSHCVINIRCSIQKW